MQPWLKPDKQICLFSKLNSFLISSINFDNFFSAFIDDPKYTLDHLCLNQTTDIHLGLYCMVHDH
jgi:hypothetical protein